jgi:ribosomal protein S18 acetylase RimI-like enzyme
MADYFIRPITSNDESFLWEMLYYALYVPPRQEPFPKEIIHTPEIALYVSGWGRAHDKGFVATDNRSGQAIGAVWMRLFPAMQPGYGYISADIPELSIALLPEYRGRGIGTDLLKHLLNKARHNYQALSLSVSPDNPAAHLYERLGFEVINRQAASLTMKKNLRG